MEIIKQVEQVAKKRDWTMAQVALAWVGKKVTSPVAGVNSVSLRHNWTEIERLLIKVCTSLAGETGRGDYDWQGIDRRRNEVS